MKITGTGKRVFLTVNGKRCGVRISKGPWVKAFDRGQVKIYPKNYSFPAGVREAFTVRNGTDIMTDYFESDSIELLPGHELYEQALAAAY